MACVANFQKMAKCLLLDCPVVILRYAICHLQLKGTRISVCLQGISRLRSDFILFVMIKRAHIYIQVCTLHNGIKQGINQQIFNRKSISCKIMHPQSLFKHSHLQCHFSDKQYKLH